jgi:hypothetical protein
MASLRVAVPPLNRHPRRELESRGFVNHRPRQVEIVLAGEHEAGRVDHLERIMDHNGLVGNDPRLARGLGLYDLPERRLRRRHSTQHPVQRFNPIQSRNVFGVNLVNPMSDAIFMDSSQVQNLRKTRDLLLPKFISGELDVEELDIETGEPPVATEAYA